MLFTTEKKCKENMINANRSMLVAIARYFSRFCQWKSENRTLNLNWDHILMETLAQFLRLLHSVRIVFE